MRNLAITLAASAALLSPHAALADQPDPDNNEARIDSVVSLGEIVVQGRTQRVIKQGVEYTPDKRTRKAAADATQLLQLMQVPQISVKAGSLEVKTLAGQDVAMFIDYKPASAEDLNGLRPEDVVKVEVLQYPDDPRFGSAPAVVNFIMQHYEWGGYTKITASGNTLSTDAGSARVYSKFAYKKWVFDASASGGLSHNSRTKNSAVQTFRDIDFAGQHFDLIQRVSASDGSNLSLSNSEWSSARASYITKNITLMHTVGFSRSATPLDRRGNSVSFTPQATAGTSSMHRESTQTLSPSISAWCSFTMPKGNSVVVNWSFAHSGTRLFSRYGVEGLPEIINNSREKSYRPTANVQYSKSLGHGNTFRTSLMTYNYIYRTDYSGSYNDRQRLLSSESMLFLEYMQNWKQGLSLYSRVGASYVVGRVNGTNTLEQWNPRLGLQLQYRINSNHSASIEGWWGNSHPSPSTASTALVQSNELLWLEGNPDLKNTIFASSTATYNYIPTDNLSFTAGARYEGNYDKQAYDYSTRPGYEGLVRRSVNSGKYHQYSLWLRGTVKMLDNKLTLSATGHAEKVVLTGIDRRRTSWFTADAQATYFAGPFSASLSYSSPNRMINAWTNGEMYKYRSTYGLSLTYTVGDLKAWLSFSNWFTSNPYLYTSFTSHRYSAQGRQWNSELSRNIALTLTYTIPYGKKINQNGDLQQSGGAGSAILH